MSPPQIPGTQPPTREFFRQKTPLPGFFLPDSSPCSTRVLPIRLGSVLLVLLAACDGPAAPNGFNDPAPLCSLAPDLLVGASVPDAIPALTEPTLIRADEAAYLDDADRVLGVVIHGEARAYPHPILWSHEVVNDRFGSRWVTVSYCPLTGSGLAMDAVVEGRRVEFAVSGLLFANNLVLFDRITEDLFGPQLAVSGRCQRFLGATPQLLPVQEMSWKEWRTLHPETQVLSDDTGYSRNYRWYPYGSYDEVGNRDLLYPMEVDDSRPLKERVLAIVPRDGVPVGFPFGALGARGARSAIHPIVAGRRAVVFYDAADGETAVAYDAELDGTALSFDAISAGDEDTNAARFRDRETGSAWTLGGKAVAGPLAGSHLTPLAHAYVMFWFAWRHFHPDGETWTTS